MSTSIKQIIDQSLRKLGVLMSGEQASPDQYSDALDALRQMLDGWSTEPLMVPYVSTERFDLSPDRAFYSMGIGGDWDTVRPEQVEHIRVIDPTGRAIHVPESAAAALVRQPMVAPGTPARHVISRDARFLYVEFDAQPLNLPHVLVTSRKPFDAVALDNFARPHDPSAPAEPIYPSGFSMAGIQTPLEFPSGYEAAILYNLAVHLRPEYPGLDLPAEVVSLAGTLKSQIKVANVRPGSLISDVGRMTRRGAAYSIEAGR